MSQETRVSAWQGGRPRSRECGIVEPARSRETAERVVLVLLAVALAMPAAAQNSGGSSQGVYRLPNPAVRTGIVQKVNPAGPKPDIVVYDLTLNGVPAPPSLTVAADQSGWTAGGKCLFTLGYHLKNAGAAATQSVLPTFVTEVAIIGPSPSSQFQSGQALAPGQVQSGQVQVWLVPGVQTATVFADPNDTIPELSESNNRRSMRVTLTGKCDGKSPASTLPKLHGYGVPDTKGQGSSGAEGGDPSNQLFLSRRLTGGTAGDTDFAIPKPRSRTASGSMPNRTTP